MGSDVEQEAEVGVCALCGQELIRTANDCWHPWNVPTACPPEPAGLAEWAERSRAGFRSGRPGREHFRAAEDPPEVRET